MRTSNTTKIHYDFEFNVTTAPRGIIYTIESGTFRNTVQILFSLVCSLIIASAIVRIIKWFHRNKNISSNGEHVSVDMTAMTIKSIVCLCHSSVLFIFPFIIGIATYWLVFGQFQHTIFLLQRVVNQTLLSESVGNDVYKALVIFIQILFWSHTVYMLHVIFNQCNIDIFFIDWEKGRGIGTSVSMWRLIMISQEYNKLQVARKSSIEINLVVITFIMQSVIGTFPLSQDFPQNKYLNAITHIILSVWIWTSTTVIQLLWKSLIVERYYSESQPQRFIDLSTITKISTFIMVEDYQGFYIHCRSPYEYADCSDEELKDYMNKEHRGIYAHRGMDDPAAPKDCQAFVFMASSIFRRQANKAIQAPHSCAARAELDSFLKSFIEQTPPPLHQGLRRKIRIASASFCEKMMGSSSSEARIRETGCLLYPDEKSCMSDYSFLSTTFLGMERDLFLQDILTYIVSLTIRNDLGSAVFFTYIMHLIRYYIRLHFGRRNISRKGFIDLRLLS